MISLSNCASHFGSVNVTSGSWHVSHSNTHHHTNQCSVSFSAITNAYERHNAAKDRGECVRESLVLAAQVIVQGHELLFVLSKLNPFGVWVLSQDNVETRADELPKHKTKTRMLQTKSTKHRSQTLLHYPHPHKTATRSNPLMTPTQTSSLAQHIHSRCTWTQTQLWVYNLLNKVAGSQLNTPTPKNKSNMSLFDSFIQLFSKPSTSSRFS